MAGRIRPSSRLPDLLIIAYGWGKYYEGLFFAERWKSFFAASMARMAAKNDFCVAARNPIYIPPKTSYTNKVNRHPFIILHII